MVKLNKRIDHDEGDVESSIDWSQLFGENLMNKSSEEKAKHIMEKFMAKENVEFDQICLVLKHLIIEKSDANNNTSFLDHFLTFDNQTYVNLLVERFDASPDFPNIQWMISEIIKLISSVCNRDQASYFLCSAEFSRLLLTSVFDVNILNLLGSPSSMTSTQETTLTNVFETISNLCEIKPEVVEFVTHTQIEWLAHALMKIDPSYVNLTISIARVLSVICEQASKPELTGQLVDVFEKEGFFRLALEHLSQDEITINARLYLIGSYVSLITKTKEAKKATSDRLLELLSHTAGGLIQHALNVDLNAPVQEKRDNKPKDGVVEDLNDEQNDELNEKEAKIIFNSFDRAIEAKLLSIDLINSISSFFIQDDNENDVESYESLDDDEDEASKEEEKGKMDVEMDDEKSSSSKLADDSSLKDLLKLINEHKLLSLLVKTIVKDDENSFQETDRIEHVYNSVKLIRHEALKVYLELVETFHLTKSSSTSFDPSLVDHLVAFMNLIVSKSAQDLEMLFGDGNDAKKDECVLKLVELVYDLFVYFNDSAEFSFSLEQQTQMVDLIKQALLKYRLAIAELSFRLARILGLIAIRVRNTNLQLGAPLIKECGLILLELTSASFEFGDENSVESLRLNAELIDVIIDVFGEDNLGDIEKSLELIGKMKVFCDRFYSKYKTITKTKNKKISKQHSVIIKTVKDNFKAFVDYKIKNSK